MSISGARISTAAVTQSNSNGQNNSPRVASSAKRNSSALNNQINSNFPSASDGFSENNVNQGGPNVGDPMDFIKNMSGSLAFPPPPSGNSPRMFALQCSI
jgi:hypothetical protein